LQGIINQLEQLKYSLSQYRPTLSEFTMLSRFEGEIAAMLEEIVENMRKDNIWNNIT